MNDTPYIHAFKTSEQCYVYDVNTDKILNIPEAVFDYLSTSVGDNVDESTIAFIQNMKSNGFLRSDRVEISEHPSTPLLPYYLNNKMYQLILQVTQKCNLRCSYCTYSGIYENRTHSNSSMSIELAENAIDFFMKRTKDSKSVTISFYGGEPLMNVDLIKHCVNYVEKRYYGKKVHYAMTTNGTLFDDGSMEFLAENSFQLLVSIDGPEIIHDARRRFASNDEGSFSTIMANVARIKEFYPEYYQENVNFNAVLNAEQNFSIINDFISNNNTLDTNKFMLNFVTDNYTDQETIISEEFHADRAYEFFKLLLSKLGEFSKDKVSHLLDSQFNEIYLRCFQNIEIEQERIPEKFHHGGPCIPGAQRLFVDTSGKLFPCERVSESSKTVLLVTPFP
jgi:uncharacterized protein